MTLKDDLPFPYDQDFSDVLHRLNRRLPETRRRLANSPVTAAYIAAAMRLIQRHLGPGVTRTRADWKDDESVERPLLGFLSQRAVADEVARNPDPFPKRGNAATLRSTWRYQSDFIADLLSFAGWSGHFPSRRDENFAAATGKLLDGPDFVAAVHDLAYWDSAALMNLTEVRLGFVMAASAENDPTIQEVYARNMRETLQPLKEIYTAVLSRRKLKLRGGLTVDDLTDILAALSLGLTLRAIADPGSQVVDHGRRRSLLGTAGLALLLGGLQREKSADSLTLEEAVEALIKDDPPNGRHTQI